MKANYGVTKYHGYIIKGIGREYELIHPDGLIGVFPTYQEAKAYVDRERKRMDDMWNKAVLEDAYGMAGFDF